MSGSLSESESKECETGYGNQKLDVYRAAIEYVGWVNRFCETLKGHRTSRWKSIPIPIPTPTFPRQQSDQRSPVVARPSRSGIESEEPERDALATLGAQLKVATGLSGGGPASRQGTVD